MSDFPVGARWRAVNSKGSWAEYWLEKRKNGREIWRWTSSRPYSFRDSRTSDWGSNRSVVQGEASYSLQRDGGGKVRFKRVKGDKP